MTRTHSSATRSAGPPPVLAVTMGMGMGPKPHGVVTYVWGCGAAPHDFFCHYDWMVPVCIVPRNRLMCAGEDL